MTATYPEHTDSELDSPGELAEWAAEYAKSVDIDVDLSQVTWSVSKRYKRKGGTTSVTPTEDGIIEGSEEITLAWKLFTGNGLDAVKKTIRHELVHLWEYQHFGESHHYNRFKQKAEEVDAPRHCSQFEEFRYQVRCVDCGYDAGGTYRLSKTTKAPEVHGTDCECNTQSTLEVTDTETNVSWRSWEEFRNRCPDRDVQAPFNYALFCASCGNPFGIRERKSKYLKHPQRFGVANCDCGPGLEVVDYRTLESWQTSAGCPD